MAASKARFGKMDWGTLMGGGEGWADRNKQHKGQVAAGRAPAEKSTNGREETYTKHRGAGLRQHTQEGQHPLANAASSASFWKGVFFFCCPFLPLLPPTIPPPPPLAGAADGEAGEAAALAGPAVVPGGGVPPRLPTADAGSAAAAAAAASLPAMPSGAT